MTLHKTSRSRDELITMIEARGFTVEFVEYCENSDTPGLLGEIRGVTDRGRRLVRIAVKANPTDPDLIETLEHEYRHVINPAWDCGNRDVLGRGAPS